MTPAKKPLLKRGSVIGKYLLEDSPIKRQYMSADLLSCASEEGTSEPKCQTSEGKKGRVPGSCDPMGNQTDGIQAAEDHGIGLAVKDPQVTEEEDDESFSDGSLPLRRQSTGNEMADLKPIHSSVDRLFKVVFVGNSGVGKTSFIRRFCNDKFLKAVSTTVGMDYQVRNLQVDETRVALQLWDTAGQERFQSITKQYFRKADGVLVMYDVTVESSFTAVRNWMESIQSDVDKEAVIFLLGNKVDTMEMKTQVLKAEGEKLAQGYNAVFYECSALSDYNVTDSMIHLARLLTEQEDKRIQKAIKLGQDSKKKGCCN
ncbi:EF-hand calcium-binding domain-containing protein 4B-like [Latimeria chalumnae]|uniref:EF-hand calcium-binding domain-containing protein 4B-like n=1 Tax=Latimeria chalumnae TaxID=7897 RepID=UPI00313CF128